MEALPDPVAQQLRALVFSGRASPWTDLAHDMGVVL